MKLNYKVGQKWLTRGGEEVTVTEIDHKTRVIMGSDGLYRTFEGRWLDNILDSDDLVKLIAEAPEVTWLTASAAEQVQEAADVSFETPATIPGIAPRYVAYENIPHGWEVMCTTSTPVRTFVIGLTHEQAQAVVKELNRGQA
jgi:hypothetical protein